nr:hypothetical protein [Tanacetum cinerariifolium]
MLRHMRELLELLVYSNHGLKAFPTHGEFFPLVRSLSIFARSSLVDLNRVTWGFFEKQKLTGPNFVDWYRQLRIVLSIEDKLNYLEQPIPHAPVVPMGQHVALEILAAHNTWIKGSREIVGLMLMTMEPEIQRNLETLHAHEILLELKTLFAQQAEQELLQTTRDFHSCKQEEGQLVSSYVLKMRGYIENIECLGHSVTLCLGKVNKHKKSQTQMAARGQNHRKRRNKQAYAPKPKIPPPPKREDLAKDSIYHECSETGHWKRNCPQYLAELLKNKKNAASGAGGSGERKPRKGQNRIKTGQKREACLSREKFKAVAVNRGRKTEQNAKRMAKNANAVKSYSSFKRKKKRKGQEMKFLQSTTTGAKTAYCPKL